MSKIDPDTTEPWTPEASTSAPSTHSTGGSTLGKQAGSVIAGMVPRVIAGALTIAVAYGAYWYFVVHKNDEAVKQSLPAVGTCFSWDDSSGATVLACTDAKALYKSESTITGAAADGATGSQAACEKVGAYIPFQITSYARNNSSQGVICGALNLKVGDCVDQGGVVDGPSVVDCAGAGTTIDKVTSIQRVATAADALSDSQASTLCGKADTTYLSDTAGRSIVCLGAAS